MANWHSLNIGSGDTIPASHMNSVKEMFLAVSEQASGATYLNASAFEPRAGVESSSVNSDPLGLQSSGSFYFTPFYKWGNWTVNLDVSSFEGFHTIGAWKSNGYVSGFNPNVYRKFKDSSGSWHDGDNFYGGLELMSSEYLHMYTASVTSYNLLVQIADYYSDDSDSNPWRNPTFVDSARLTTFAYNGLLENFNAVAKGHTDAPKFTTSGGALRAILYPGSEFTLTTESEYIHMPAGLLLVSIVGSANECGHLRYRQISETSSTSILPDGREGWRSMAYLYNSVPDRWLAPGAQSQVIFSTGSNFIFFRPNDGTDPFTQPIVNDSKIYWQFLTRTTSNGNQAFDMTNKAYGHSVVASDFNILNDYVTSFLEGVDASSGYDITKFRLNAIDHSAYTEGVNTLAAGSSFMVDGLYQIMKTATDNQDLAIEMIVGSTWVSGTISAVEYPNAKKWCRTTWGDGVRVRVKNSGASPRGFHWRRF